MSELLAIGMIVTADDPRTPGLFKVINKGTKNWTITPVSADGSARPGKGARFPGHLLTPVDAAAAADIDAELLKDNAGRVIGVPFDPTPPGPMLWAGTVVRFAQDGQIYVVLADKVDKVNIARIGGNEGRYYRATPSSLTVIPLADLAGLLA